MPSHALLIAVRLPNGRYHGVGDWPPSPFRLFQALVAGAYGGRWRAESDDDKDAAFRWLEGLTPPHIAAPPTIAGRATTYFVPNNDIDTVEGDPRRVAEIRTGKLVRPILLAADLPLLYVWPFDGGEDHARHVCDLAARLHTLGHGIDAAFASAQVCAWADAEARLAHHGGTVARPGMSGDPEHDPLCPLAGSLDSLKRRNAADAARFERRREGRSTVTLFNQPPKALSRAITYGREPARLLFELRALEDATAFRPTPQELASRLVVAIRDLAARRLTELLPEHVAEVRRLVVGEGAASADLGRRVRIVPLPSIGHEHASPSIRRVLVEVPPDCPFSRKDLALALSNQLADWIDAATGEVLEEGAILIPTEDEAMLGHYGVGNRVFRRWQSITPVALPATRRKRLDRAAADREAAASVADALRHAGIDWRGITVRVQREPFSRGGARADRYDTSRFSGRLQHVEVRLPRPARGPLVIGDGRWLGFGVMAPVRDGPPALHVFAIDPSEAPPLAERETLLRALRNALMARVDPIWRGGRRDRRNEPLPVFFGGHQSTGEPARSGRHEHVFFLADDRDGNGRIERVAVVAPHLADRSVAYDPSRRSLMRDHLEMLDRALADFTQLRAGRAGAPRLAPVPEPGDGDPLFGRARSWVSRTPYRPTRHPKREDIHEAITADVITECARRGLPRPEVEVVDATIGPRGGLVARLRLQFATAIHGPLLLGRDSHFGAGMFAADG